MKNKIALLIVIVIVLSSFTMFASCGPKYMTPPTINGVALADYTIVYDFDGLDYNKRAAEYIKNTAQTRYGVDIQIVDDNSAKTAHEIVVGETSREISSSLEVETEGLEFSILANEGSIALEGDYFVIAAAAYFFMESYASQNAQDSTVPQSTEVHKPIVKEAKNFIMLIGDGMGVYQTRLFEYMDNTCEFGDGEDIFYGYMLPYIGKSRTDSILGTTDSAAGATALACGTKTINGYIGIDRNYLPLKSLTELAYELGMSAAVMSTEDETGATPASFVAHINSRNNSTNIIEDIAAAYELYGTIVDCGYDYYTANQMSITEDHIENTLQKVSSNENGFFLMYEEAHIDKYCHKNDIDKTFQVVIRFNQAIARFMEFAFYNPDTLVLITADHETGKLYPEEDGTLAYHYDDHSSEDVLIFAYGYGAEVFDDAYIENIQIGHTFAAFMGDENFGDQSKYQSLTKTNK